MKFKLEHIGPIKEAEIELGDITLFLGFPSTGKSYALRSIYSSLIPLDTAFEITLKEAIFNSLSSEDLWIKSDYILSYLTNVFASGSCLNIGLELERLEKEHNIRIQKDIKISENNCEVSVNLFEIVNAPTLIQKTIRKIKEALKNELLRVLKESVNYDNSSSILINDIPLSSFIDNMNISISNKELKKINNAIIPYYTSSDRGEFQVGKKVSYDDEKNTIGLNISAYIRMNNISKAIESQSALKANYSPIASEIIPHYVIYNCILEVLRIQSGYNSIAFLPYGKSVISMMFNRLPSYTRLRADFFIPSIMTPNVQLLESVVKQLDWNYRSFVEHFSGGKYLIKEKKVSDSKKYILNLITSSTGMNITVDELYQLYYELGNKTLIPSLVSAMANEISTMLIPLLDLETPSLVFIEEPEAQLHPAYQLVLAVMLLSLVSMSYKFVISTHSDIFAQFLGELVKYKPSKEKILELLKNILGEIPPVFDEMAERAVNALKEIKLHTYHFKEGEVNSVSIDDLVIRIPGITKEVMDKLFYWMLEVSENGSRET